MRFKLLGRSGLRVSELALGTMTFGEDWGWGSSKEESKRIFDAYANAGGNFIDTANRYTEGTSEKYVGEFIHSDRDHFVLATKYTLKTRNNDPNFSGNHRKNMVQSLDASLKRLNTDYIDLYWVHAWDFITPVDEVMRALDDMVSAGKILYIGISDTPAWIISQANTIADFRGWSRFAGIQIHYSLIERTAERDLIPMAENFELGITVWGAVGAGILTGKYNQPDLPKEGRAAHRPPVEKNKLDIASGVMKIAEETGRTPSQVAINWARKQSKFIIPILGARTLPQIEDNLKCVEFDLSSDHLKRLNDISKIDLGFPHEMLRKDTIRDIVYGGSYDKIDIHRS